MALVALNVALSLLNIAVAVPRPNPYDAAGYMAWEQAVLAGERFDPSHRLEGNSFFPRFLLNGRERALDKFPIGWSVAVFPFAAAGQGFCWLLNHTFHQHYPLDGTAAPVVRMAWVGVAFWTTIGLLAVYSVTERLLDPAAAAVGLLLAWAGTAALAYTWKSPGLSHPVSFTFIALCYRFSLDAVESDEKVRSRVFYALLWGAAAGMVFCLRHLNVILVLPSALLLLYCDLPAMQKTVGQPTKPHGSLLPSVLPATLVGAAPFIFLQSLVWRIDYGHWYFNGYALLGEHFTHSVKNVCLFLFSSLHGLFFWHLVTAAALVGLYRLARLSFFGLALSLAAVAIALLYGLWWDWDLGPCYGARWTTDLLVVWAIGIAVMTRDQSGVFQPRRALALAVIALPGFLLVSGQIAGRLPLYARLHLYIPGSGWHELP